MIHLILQRIKYFKESIAAKLPACMYLLLDRKYRNSMKQYIQK